MDIHISSFLIGFFVATLFSAVFILVSFEVRKKRAVAFTKRFAIISEGLSSLKALCFRVSERIGNIEIDSYNPSFEEMQRLQNSMESVRLVFDSISAGMMPPTEEIALEALRGRRGSSEDRAYEDSKKFRDNIRYLRKKLEEKGLEGLSEELKNKTSSEGPPVEIYD